MSTPSSPDARRSPRLLIAGGIAAALAVVGAAALLLAPGSPSTGAAEVKTGADEASFCSSVNTAMTASDDGVVRDAVKDITDMGVPTALADTTASPGVEVFIDLTKEVGAAGIDYWSDLGVADNRTGQERTDLAAFLYYAYVHCEAPSLPSS